MLIDLIIITSLTLFASTIGSVTGFGTSTLMVPFMLAFLPLDQTLLFVGIIHWFTGLWRIILFRKAFKESFKLELVLSFALPAIIFSVLGAGLVFTLPEILLKKSLATFLMGYVIFLVYNPKFELKYNIWITTAFAVISGFLSGLFGMGGAIRATLLTALNLAKGTYIVTSGSISILVDSARLITYIKSGALLEEWYLYGLLIFIPASFLGTKLARFIVNRISQETFRMLVGFFLFLVAVKLLF